MKPKLSKNCWLQNRVGYVLFWLSIITLTGAVYGSDTKFGEEEKSHLRGKRHTMVEKDGYAVFTVHFEEMAGVLYMFAWFILVAGLKIAYENLHHSEKIPGVLKKFPESCVLIIVGLFLGLVISKDFEQRIELIFTQHSFFIYILPPIIFEAAYTVELRPLSNHSFEIFIYAVVGTLMNTVMVGGSLIGLNGAFISSGVFPEHNITISNSSDLSTNGTLITDGIHDQSTTAAGGMTDLRYLLYAAIISAVDPVAVLAVFDQIHVNTTLYILVFGESLMNDGIAVVLFTVLEQLLEVEVAFDAALLFTIFGHFLYIVIGGILIGVIFGAIIAFITKYTYAAPMMETIVVFGLSYTSYLIAEGLKTSAILAIVFCAITMRTYVHHNITRESDIAIQNSGKMLAILCEATIFLNLGIVGITHMKEYFVKCLPLFFASISFCLIYRFLIVFFLTYLINRFYRENKIKLKDQVIMAYGGLRGGIAFSLMQIAKMGFESIGEHHGDSSLSPEHRDIKGVLICSTLLIVLFTCFIQGTTISYVVNWLSVEKQEAKRERSHFEESAREIIQEVMMGVRGIVSNRVGKQYFWFWFDRVKHKHLNPLFQRDPETSTYFDKKLRRKFEHVNVQEKEELLTKIEDYLKYNGHKRLSKLDFAKLLETPNENDKRQTHINGEPIKEIFKNASHKRRNRDSASSSNYQRTYDGSVNPPANRSRASQLWMRATSNVIKKDQAYHDPNTR